jgi:vacuolar-type H+-ATPase subunit E/Vma4
MAEQPLIDAIRHEGDADVQAAWTAARTAVDTCKARCAHALEDARREASQAAKAKTTTIEAAASLRAETDARRIRAAAKAALARRLYELAMSTLRDFRSTRYAELFAALAADLPAGSWQRVVVHPADEALARRHFPDAHIECDAEVDAGLIVETADRRVRVDNTLRTRLDAAWPDLLPAVMKDVHGALPPR